MIKIYKISGNSLYPFYKDNEKVVCIKVFKLSKCRMAMNIFNYKTIKEFIKIKNGDYVVFDKQPYGRMIKKVKYIQDDKYFVQGTDPLSIDSRNFGLIDFCEIKYKVYFTLPF